MHQKLQSYVETVSPLWISPLVLPYEVNDSPNKSVDWQLIVQKEWFFEKKRFLHVLVEDPDKLEDLQIKSNQEDAEWTGFSLPNRNLAIVRNVTTEIKRII